jgi:hypothetical protein
MRFEAEGQKEFNFHLANADEVNFWLQLQQSNSHRWSSVLKRTSFLVLKKELILVISE